MSLVTPSLKLLQIAINRYLDFDPEAPKQLVKMQGKVVLLNFQPWDIQLFVMLTRDGVDLLDDMNGEVDTTISGSPLSLVMMNVHKSSTSSLFAGDVTIEGDLELGNQFQAFIKNIEVDWEEPLSQLTGDVVANKVGELAQGMSSWLLDISKTNAMNMAEFAREEKNFLPSAFEVERFKKNVDELCLATDRIEAKIKRLIANRQNENELEKDAT
jgi:ubiquinone biosynthesis protein UbiJ